jgi:hypothetical protein
MSDRLWTSEDGTFIPKSYRGRCRHCQRPIPKRVDTDAYVRLNRNGVLLRYFDCVCGREVLLGLGPVTVEDDPVEAA